MEDKLHAIEERFERLTEDMAQPEVLADYQRLQALAKERASI
jgi:peptide chain release factor 1